MKKKEEEQRSGRVVFDGLDRAIWEWRTETGAFSRDIDTARVRALQEDAAQRFGEMRSHALGYDPYATADRRPMQQQRRRRTLDDMRKLSEQIKQGRRAKGSERWADVSRRAEVTATPKPQCITATAAEREERLASPRW